MSTLFPIQRKVLSFLQRKSDKNASFNELIQAVEIELRITIAPEIMHNHLFHLQTQGLITRTNAENSPPKSYTITEKGLVKITEAESQKA